MIQPLAKNSALPTGNRVEPAVPAPQVLSEELPPFNRICFYTALATVFLQFSMLHQILGALAGTNLYLLFVVGIPAILGVLLSGGVKRAFRGHPAIYWTGFACWMLIATPFSSWRGGSAAACIDYWRTSLISLFLIAGAVVNWRDVKKLMGAIAFAAIVSIIGARIFDVDRGGRLGLSVGTVGNPNDYAAHLLLLLPFLVWVVLSGKLLWRVFALAGIGAGLYLILATGSRGALVAIAVGLLFFFWRATGRQKFALILVAPIAFIAVFGLLSSSVLRRLSALSSEVATSSEAAEALESSAARAYTLKTSIRYTFEHPIFGVGPQQFAGYEGGHERVVGTHGYWHDTHNSYTEAAAECGLPAFVFFICGIGSTLLLLNRTFRQARARTDSLDIRNAAFCAMLALVSFSVAIIFLSFAYFFYLPAMGGLAIALHTSAQREFQVRDLACSNSGQSPGYAR